MLQSREATLLMTRPLPQGAAFAEALQAEFPKLRVVVSPVLKIVPGGAPDLTNAKGLVFTSQNGVRSFADLSDRRDLPAFCLGARTTLAARAVGLVAEQAGHNAETLVETLPGRNPPKPLLHLRGAHSVGDVAARLSDAGITCDAQIIYDQEPVDLTEEARQALSGNSLILLPVFSPRSAAILSEQMVDTAAPIVAAWMSATVRDAWVGPAPMAQAVAETPDAEALRQALLGAIATALQLEGPDAGG